MPRLAVYVECIGCLGLHPIRQLERFDPRLKPGITNALFHVALIELLSQIELSTLGAE